jgi:hypothetical protein
LSRLPAPVLVVVPLVPVVVVVMAFVSVVALVPVVVPVVPVVVSVVSVVPVVPVVVPVVPVVPVVVPVVVAWLAPAVLVRLAWVVLRRLDSVRGRRHRWGGVRDGARTERSESGGGEADRRQHGTSCDKVHSHEFLHCADDLSSALFYTRTPPPGHKAKVDS